MYVLFGAYQNGFGWQVPFKMQDYHFWDLAAALNFTYLPIGDKAEGKTDLNHLLLLQTLAEFLGKICLDLQNLSKMNA